MKNKNVTIIAEHLHFVRLDVVQQKVDALAFKSQKNRQLSLGHKISHNLKDERIKMELAFSFEDANKEQLLFFQIDFYYHVEQLANYYQLKEEDQPEFYSPLITTLLGISLSTARGIIFEKLQNAGIGNVIIPIVSPQKIIAKQI